MGQNAGFWIRLGALLLDGLIVGIPGSLIANMIVDGQRAVENMNSFFMLLYQVIVPAVWMGFTIGKRICGIRVQKLDGSFPGIGTMLMRYVVSGLVYAITLGIGVIVSAFMVGLREDKRAIHDFIAGTEVVKV